MLCKYLSELNQMRIILASGSARRSQILRENLQLVIEVIPSSFAEDIDKSTTNGPSDYVQQTCRMKCLDSIKTNCNSEEKEKWPDIIIAADTIVVYDQKILEKPSSTQHAIEMLQMLSGKKHHVLTAVTIAILNKDDNHKDDILKNYNVKTFYESTEVHFDDLDMDTIEAYVATGDPFDKAGGYGIQSIASSLIKQLHGCYFNVVGFPIHRFTKELLTMLK